MDASRLSAGLATSKNPRHSPLSRAERLLWLRPDRDDGLLTGEPLEIGVVATTTPEGEAHLAVVGDSTVARGIRDQGELKSALIRAFRHPARVPGGGRGVERASLKIAAMIPRMMM